MHKCRHTQTQNFKRITAHAALGRYSRQPLSSQLHTPRAKSCEGSRTQCNLNRSGVLTSAGRPIGRERILRKCTRVYRAGGRRASARGASLGGWWRRQARCGAPRWQRRRPPSASVFPSGRLVLACGCNFPPLRKPRALRLATRTHAMSCSAWAPNFSSCFGTRCDHSPEIFLGLGFGCCWQRLGAIEAFKG